MVVIHGMMIMWIIRIFEEFTSNSHRPYNNAWIISSFNIEFAGLRILFKMLKSRSLDEDEAG